MTAASAPYPTRDGELRPNLATGPLSNQGRRRSPTPNRPDFLPICPQPRSPAMYNLPPRLSFEQYTSSESSDTEASPSSHTALISTRDLMALDRYLADKVAALTGSSLLSPVPPQIHVISPGTSPNARYLPPGSQPLQIPFYDGHPVALPPAYSNALSPGSPPPPYGTSMTISPSSAAFDLATMPASAPAAGNDILHYQHSPRQHSHLAPDSKGQTIPLDATWTKVDRKLVSPEVLEQAGVRYEARPSFVAVLGILTREQIEEFARKSFEVRNARSSPTTRAGTNVESQGRDRTRQETYSDHYRRRAGQSTNNESSEGLFDASDSDASSNDEARRRDPAHRGRYTPRDYHANRNRQQQPDSDDDADERGSASTKAYPIIVSPPASVVGGGGAADSLSPSSTVAPKPILKNKNPNHVRFDRSGPKEISPGQYSSSDRQRRDRERDRPSRERDRDRDRDRERDRDRDRDRDRPRRDKSPERPRDRSRAVDKERDRDRDQQDPRSSSKRHSDRDRDRDRDQHGAENRPSRRTTFKEAAGAIGVGGAAATLLSVLTQAAQHL